MIEFRDQVQLVAEVQRRIVGHEGVRLIGLDGAYGSGKSTLARWLAKNLDGVALEVDKYTRRNGKPYRQQLRYADLRRDMEQVLTTGKPVIVDGVCLLHVLREIEAKADVQVYVKRLGESGIWQDEDTCDPAWIDLKSPMLNIPGSELAREVAAYHIEHDPLAKADVVFLRVEDPFHP